MKTSELYQSPNYEKNEDLLKPGHTERCVCCNKPMKPEQVKFMVHMTTDWVAVNTEDLNVVSEKGYQSQGFFPIGSECKKKMGKEFIFDSF
jgi:hypothetical protein